MEQTSLVLTVVGDDKPGLVEAVAQTIAAHGGNWLESRMAHFAGKFAGILRVEVAPESADSLTEALLALRTRGLQIVAEKGAAARQRFRDVTLEIVGSDHRGIVRDISTVLARHGVNVDELETERTSAPVSGDPMFRARASLHLPESVDVDTLRGALESVANDLMVDLTLEDGLPSRDPAQEE